MGRIFWQFVGILLLIGFIGAYFWWIAAWRLSPRSYAGAHVRSLEWALTTKVRRI